MAISEQDWLGLVSGSDEEEEEEDLLEPDDLDRFAEENNYQNPRPKNEYRPSDVSSNSSEISDADWVVAYTCKKCDLAFEEAGDGRRHARIDHQYQCPVPDCTYLAIFKRHVRKHRQDVHGHFSTLGGAGGERKSRKPRSCLYCERTFPSKIMATMHMKHAHAMQIHASLLAKSRKPEMILPPSQKPLPQACLVCGHAENQWGRLIGHTLRAHGYQAVEDLNRAQLVANRYRNKRRSPDEPLLFLK